MTHQRPRFSRLLLTVASLLLGSLVSPAAPADLTVFAGGRAGISLDLDFEAFDGKPGELEEKTLADFRRCFRVITGHDLPTAAAGLVPLRARRGPADPDAPRPFGLDAGDCAIDVSADAIVLTAPRTLGIVNGLYAILDDWGCRWVLPGELGEVIPTADTLTLTAGRRVIRSGLDSRVDSDWRQGDDYPDWLRRNRRARQTWITAQHYWLNAIPPATYFEEHPEYFALIGGKRVPSQLCTSNPEVRELMVRKAREFFASHPTADSFPMDPADNFDHCQCEACTRLDTPGELCGGYPCVSNRVAAFANDVAERLAADYPDKLVGFYAYANKKNPPTIPLNDHVVIGYTRDSSSLLHLTPHDAVSSSVAYWDDLERWQAVCPRIYAYEYDPISWIGGLPCPIYLERAKALQRQAAMGLMGAIDDMGPRADATLFVNRYLGARFEATPQLAPERELAAMCNAFFGPVGDHLNHYYLTLATSTDTPIDIRFGIAGYERIFTPEQIATARAHLQRALDDPRLAALPLIRRRVHMVDLAQTYLERFLTFNWNLDKPDYDRSQQDARRIDEAIDALAAAGPHYIDAQDAKRRTTTSVMKGLARHFPDTMRFFRSWDLVGPFDNQQRDGMVVAAPLTRPRSPVPAAPTASPTHPSPPPPTPPPKASSTSISPSPTGTPPGAPSMPTPPPPSPCRRPVPPSSEPPASIPTNSG